MKMGFVTGLENSGRGTLAIICWQTVHMILPGLCMNFLHNCHLVGMEFKIWMQNASYHSVRQTQSKSMFSSWLLRRLENRLPYYLDIYRHMNGFWLSRCFFFNIDLVAFTESTHLKIVFWLGNLAWYLSWKWVQKARWVAITVSILEESLYDETTLFSRPLHFTISLVQINYVLHSTLFTRRLHLTMSSASKRCADLQLSIFIYLSCHSNWIP